MLHRNLYPNSYHYVASKCRAIDEIIVKYERTLICGIPVDVPLSCALSKTFLVLSCNVFEFEELFCLNDICFSFFCVLPQYAARNSSKTKILNFKISFFRISKRQMIQKFHSFEQHFYLRPTEFSIFVISYTFGFVRIEILIELP